MDAGTIAGLTAITVAGFVAAFVVTCACVVAGRISHNQSDAAAGTAGRRSPLPENEQSSREV